MTGDLEPIGPLVAAEMRRLADLNGLDYDPALEVIGGKTEPEAEAA